MKVTVEAYGLAGVIVYAGLGIRQSWSLFETQINLNKNKNEPDIYMKNEKHRQDD